MQSFVAYATKDCVRFCGASVKLFLPSFKPNFPGIASIALLAEGIFYNHLSEFMRLNFLAVWWAKSTSRICVTSLPSQDDSLIRQDSYCRPLRHLKPQFL